MVQKLHNFFIPRSYGLNSKQLRSAKVLVNSSLLTSLFSISYLLISAIIGFDEGVVLMVFNIAIFLALPFLLKLKIPLPVVGNIYVAAGSLAILILIYFSGGFRSPILPWLVAGPTISLLIGNKLSAYVWAFLHLLAIVYFGLHEIQGNIFPVTYDPDWHISFSLQVYLGLLLIIFVINLVFEQNRSSALKLVEEKNSELEQALSKLEMSQSEVLAQSELLTELNEEQDHMIDILAHDLRSPLNAIEGLISIINFDKDKLTTEQQECLDKILVSTKKSKELVGKVMELGAAEQKKIKLDMRATNVSEIVASVVERNKVLAREKGMKIKYTIPDISVQILADQTYLEQILDNLISNSIKFSPKNSEIVVLCGLEGGNLRISVSDQGPGIKEEEMHMLFGKFSRLSNLPTGNESSSGLGLSLVKRYVEMMKGEVWCQSTPGKGATFIISFNQLIKK